MGLVQDVAHLINRLVVADQFAMEARGLNHSRVARARFIAVFIVDTILDVLPHEPARLIRVGADTAEAIVLAFVFVRRTEASSGRDFLDDAAPAVATISTNKPVFLRAIHLARRSSAVIHHHFLARNANTVRRKQLGLDGESRDVRRVRLQRANRNQITRSLFLVVLLIAIVLITIVGVVLVININLADFPAQKLTSFPQLSEFALLHASSLLVGGHGIRAREHVFIRSSGKNLLLRR
mmetsp:Transcript_9272/g.16709  ORF Transcript_9272/g.16709 Transcript_9272/m.16709 type:complete len:238 (+) Transcript_9272:657-1370(+)